MELDVYLICGRGEKGDKFQLGQVFNKEGYYYKDEYDPTTQYNNMDELQDVLAKMVKVDKASLKLNQINL
ncbi:hypothetical protein [Marinomonas profundimaris]|uniref:Uncharacterized protein n=1 Tax=Marinomonas profundimaris TaxID=1208321 RepID=W1RZJ5_9GAMM|nr:hypothetical protein [Marinomonas profundimaris]ETI62616.1 hypothetical protein D104_02135 [Marinomonas profundimaris]